MTTSSIASSKSSGKRDMWTPFWSGSRSTEQSISAAISFSRPAWLSRIALETPVTPTRDRPIRTSGGDACRSGVRISRLVMSAQDTFPQLVSLACHDLRTPLATVSGFAKTMVRMEGVDEKIARYLGMIDAAGGQLAELLEDLALVSRIESGRYDPPLAEVDSLELARAAAEPLGESAAVAGSGTLVGVALDDARRALGAIAHCALRHGGLDRVELTVDGVALTISPVTPETAAICLGRELRDFPAAVGARAIDALGGSVAEEDGALIVRLPLAPAVS